jgi:hypothetical protein
MQSWAERDRTAFSQAQLSMKLQGCITASYSLTERGKKALETNVVDKTASLKDAAKD